MHVGTWPLFMTWGFSLCPILRPFNGISSSLLPLLRLLYSYYIICDPNRKCYSSMSGASADYLDTSSSTTYSSAAASSTSTLPSSTVASIEFSIGKARVQICSSSSLECWTPSDFGHWPICIRKHKKESCRNEKKAEKSQKEEARKNTKFMGDNIMIGLRRVRCIFNCTKRFYIIWLDKAPRWPSETG